MPQTNPPPPQKKGRQADRKLIMVKKLFFPCNNILPKVLGHPRLMNRIDYFSNLQEYKS